MCQTTDFPNAIDVLFGTHGSKTFDAWLKKKKKDNLICPHSNPIHYNPSL